MTVRQRQFAERTVYVAKCPTCGATDIRAENPPREHLCECGTWVRFTPESYVGPDKFTTPETK